MSVFKEHDVGPAHCHLVCRNDVQGQSMYIIQVSETGSMITAVAG